MIRNLIANAVEHAGAGGRVTVGARALGRKPRDRGGRRRPGHPARGARARLRSFPPGRRLALAPLRGQRARAGDRQGRSSRRTGARSPPRSPRSAAPGSPSRCPGTSRVRARLGEVEAGLGRVALLALVLPVGALAEAGALQHLEARAGRTSSASPRSRSRAARGRTPSAAAGSPRGSSRRARRSAARSPRSRSRIPCRRRRPRPPWPSSSSRIVTCCSSPQKGLVSSKERSGCSSRPKLWGRL